jgi:hypothetical protein
MLAEPLAGQRSASPRTGQPHCGLADASARGRRETRVAVSIPKSCKHWEAQMTYVTPGIGTSLPWASFGWSSVRSASRSRSSSYSCASPARQGRPEPAHPSGSWSPGTTTTSSKSLPLDRRKSREPAQSRAPARGTRPRQSGIARSASAVRRAALRRTNRTTQMIAPSATTASAISSGVLSVLKASRP